MRRNSMELWIKYVYIIMHIENASDKPNVLSLLQKAQTRLHKFQKTTMFKVISKLKNKLSKQKNRIQMN